MTVARGFCLLSDTEQRQACRRLPGQNACVGAGGERHGSALCRPGRAVEEARLHVTVVSLELGAQQRHALLRRVEPCLLPLWTRFVLGSSGKPINALDSRSAAEKLRGCPTPGPLGAGSIVSTPASVRFAGRGRGRFLFGAGLAGGPSRGHRQATEGGSWRRWP